MRKPDEITQIDDDTQTDRPPEPPGPPPGLMPPPPPQDMQPTQPPLPPPPPIPKAPGPPPWKVVKQERENTNGTLADAEEEEAEDPLEPGSSAYEAAANLQLRDEVM